MTKAVCTYLFVLVNLLAVLPCTLKAAIAGKKTAQGNHVTINRSYISCKQCGYDTARQLAVPGHRDIYSIHDDSNLLSVFTGPLTGISMYFPATAFSVCNDYEPTRLDNRLLHIYPFHHFW